jgi:hypothetical protein
MFFVDLVNFYLEVFWFKKEESLTKLRINS